MGEKWENKQEERLGEIKYNKQGSLMKIIRYNNVFDISVEFIDQYHYIVEHNVYKNFKDGLIKNPYYPSLLGIGAIGEKYPARINYELTKEYRVWAAMIKRCYDTQSKKLRNMSYEDCTVCKEWLLYENFYEWIHSQDNFYQWNQNFGWDIDKDILRKGNKIYQPDSCCLLPENVNTLFIKRKCYRGNLPIGVIKHGNKYIAQCKHLRERVYLGLYTTIEEAFNAYKKYKEKLIKQVAEEEYLKGNITKRCYDAMMTYEVEITD